MASRTHVPYAPGGPPNRKRYPFFVDDQMNAVIPPWFVDCERDEAERKLFRRYPDKNVFLMRLSKTSGHFAITVQTFNSRRAVVMNHYSVIFGKANATFRIEIDKPHAPTRTLSEIMELFIKLTRPTNYCIYGLETSTSTSPSSPSSPLSPLAPNGSAPILHFPRLPPSKPAAAIPTTRISNNTSGQQFTEDGYLRTDVYDASGRQFTDDEYLRTNVDVDELENQFSEVVLPAGQRGPKVSRRPIHSYLELLNDVPANNSRVDGEYLTTNYSEEREENQFGSVGSPITKTTACTSDEYIVPQDDDDVMAPQHKAPPPPATRKAPGNSALKKTETATGTGAPVYDYIRPIADDDDDDYVPHAPRHAPPTPSSSVLTRSATQIITRNQPDFKKNLRVNCGINRSGSMK